MSDPVFSIQSEFFPTSVDVVFDAFNDVEGWPRWAVHHIKSEVRNPDGTYGIQTPRRTGVPPPENGTVVSGSSTTSLTTRRRALGWCRGVSRPLPMARYYRLITVSRPVCRTSTSHMG